MADPADRARHNEQAPSLLAQAARAALNAAMAVTPASGDGDVTMPAWIERLIAPFRPMLGGLVGALPRILQRVGSPADGADGPVLLFRATLPKPKEFEEEAKQASRVTVTDSLRRRLDAKLENLDVKAALGRLDALTQDPRRLDLPRLLQDLKQEVRKDRASGLSLVREKLGWMFGPEGDPEPAYELLDRLSDALGEENLRALRRRQLLHALLAGQPVTAEQRRALQGVFDSIGCPLPSALSVVETGQSGTLTLHVGDHEQDRRYEVTHRPSRLAGMLEMEVYGAAAGGDYTHLQEGGLRLPLRVQDAANGFVTWMVDRRAVHDSPECFARDGDLRMRAFDAGGQRTPLALFFVHHRDTDAGRYFELGLGCFVAPQKDPLAVGMTALGRILVSSVRGARLGSEIWGWDKEHVPEDRWEVLYRPDALHCRVPVPGAEIELVLPRGGSACTTAMPALLYTRKPNRGPWHRSAMLRSGRGEQLRAAGGGVTLKVRIEDRQAALAHPLVHELYRLGLIDAQGVLQLEPQFAAWSEHVAAELGPPLPLPLPEPLFD
jgi:hypothetical protein